MWSVWCGGWYPIDRESVDGPSLSMEMHEQGSVDRSVESG